MKPQSKKNKGSRFERLIAKEIELAGLGKAHRELMSGGGWRKGDIASSLPFLIEAKNQKRIDINRWIDQAKREAEQGNWDRDKWALVFKDPRTPETRPDIYTIIDFWEWLKLLKKNQAPKIKEPDRQLKWKLEKLKNIINQVLRELK